MQTYVLSGHPPGLILLPETDCPAILEPKKVRIMKKSICLFVVSLLTLAFSAHLQAKKTKKSGTSLTITITKVKSAKGQFYIALFNKSKGFPDGSKAKYRQAVKASKGKVVVVFKNIPPGTYAVSTFHDANSNKKMDKSFFGIPKEGYGFSRDARGTFGPPSFAKASFYIGKKAHVISLTMKY